MVTPLYLLVSCLNTLTASSLSPIIFIEVIVRVKEKERKEEIEKDRKKR